ncbi:CLUMA_CG010358, isoform A [Clunio marinus]|uniref:CLUMA_CG010358, isoform A n=1 Tax=Clunio marinus TaxID=568069 RepID=A0A1J1I9L4_9DIPT|nr:CLUMA_CG010358, isoform A [Clunio marinus]
MKEGEEILKNLFECSFRLFASQLTFRRIRHILDIVCVRQASTDSENGLKVRSPVYKAVRHDHEIINLLSDCDKNQEGENDSFTWFIECLIIARYADDVAIIIPDKNMVHACQRMNRCMRIVERWCQKWKMMRSQCSIIFTSLKLLLKVQTTFHRLI